MKSTKPSAFKSVPPKGNRTWELDWTCLDIPGRPGMLTITDTVSRTLVSSRIAAKLTPAVLAACVGEASRNLGVPKQLVVDNGPEFVSKEFRDLAHSLGATIVAGSHGLSGKPRS